MKIKKWEDIIEEEFQKLELKNSSFRIVNNRFVVIVNGSVEDAHNASTQVSIEYQTHI